MNKLKLIKNFLQQKLSNIDETDKIFLYRAIILAVAIRVALYAIAYISGRTLAGIDKPFDLLLGEVLNRWDAIRYMQLAQNGYANDIINFRPESIAFFPLFPTILSLVGYITPNLTWAGIIVTFVSSIAAGFYLQKLVKLELGDNEAAKRSLSLFFLFPTAYFLFIPYTESLFLALSIYCFYAARQKNWRACGIVGMFASLTRLQGFLIMPAIAIEFWNQRKELNIKKIFWLLLIPCGTLIYMMINWLLMDYPLAFMDIQKSFYNHVIVFPGANLVNAFNIIRSLKASAYVTTYYESQFVIIIPVILLLLSVKWLRLSYQFYSWGLILLLLVDSWPVSSLRYIFSIFPLFIILAKFTKKEEVFQSLCICFTILMGGLFIIYSKGDWAF